MITVFGSVNLDIVLNVAVFPKAGETVLGFEPLYFAGGKGANQAFAAAGAGAEVCMIGAVGQDEQAERALAGLQARDVRLGDLQVQKDRATSQAFITVDERGENCIIVAEGANGALKAELVPDAVLAASEFLLFQMEVPVAESLALMRRARGFDLRTVLTAAPMSRDVLDLLEFVDILAVNEGELGALAELIGGDWGGDFASYLMQKYGFEILLTKGADGAEYRTGEDWVEVKAEAITPVDTTGAGDAFLSVFCAQRALGADVAKALEEASRTAARNCLVVGAQAG